MVLNRMLMLFGLISEKSPAPIKALHTSLSTLTTSFLLWSQLQYAASLPRMFLMNLPLTKFVLYAPRTLLITQFKNQVRSGICQQLEIKQTFITAHHPGSNGLVDWINREMRKLQRSFVIMQIIFRNHGKISYSMLLLVLANQLIHLRTKCLTKSCLATTNDCLLIFFCRLFAPSVSLMTILRCSSTDFKQCMLL